MRLLGFREKAWGMSPVSVILGLTCACFGLYPESAAARYPTSAEFQKPLEIIAFGSCNDQDDPQPFWPVVEAAGPDLWIWLGDNIYADTRDLTLFRKKYALQSAVPEYARFRENVPIIGTWDDHDFGENDAGSEYPHREAAQALALDFLDEPPDSPRRTQAGLYASYRFGPEGQQVQVILLDTRYHMTTPAKDSTLLGEAQWAWLEARLNEVPAEITILGSSIQVVSDEHPWESWARHPHERARLVKTLAKSGREGVFFISGDRHIHELSCWRKAGLGYPLYDLTSSGLTHAWESFEGEANRWRLAGPSNQTGFGLIRIDWEKSPIVITLEVRKTDGSLKFSHSFERPRLSAGN
ncbi:MAG: alkaline phosphatase D family protein [Opitutales bacterium]